MPTARPITVEAVPSLFPDAPNERHYLGQSII